MPKLLGEIWGRIRYLYGLKIFSHRLLNNYKGKKDNFLMENVADAFLAKWSKLTSPIMAQTDITYLLMWCSEKGYNITSVVFL